MKNHLLFAMGLLLAACEPVTTEAGAATDAEVLKACADAPCPRAAASREGDELFFQLDNMECTVAAMRDRTPGVYQVSVTDSFIHQDLTILLTASGEALVANHVGGLADGDTGETKDEWEPTRRCALRPATFFEDCLAAVQAADVEQKQGLAEAFECVYPSPEGQVPWFEACEESAPACE